MLKLITYEAKSPKRTLKVYTNYVKRFKGYFRLPEIRLSGKWLQDLGFNCGGNVTVLTEKNRIIIIKSEKIIIRL